MVKVAATAIVSASRAKTKSFAGKLNEPVSLILDEKVEDPIRIRAGAFGANLPRRDLRLSPGHHLFADGLLVPASALVNGETILVDPVEPVTYWHVELDSHDVLLAEALPCDSYLDTGNP
jgi:hypothetical protein